jgi:subtilisin family serine protease
MNSRIASVIALFVIIMLILTPILSIVNASSVESKIDPLLLKRLVEYKDSEVVEVVVRIKPLPRELTLSVKGNYYAAVNALKWWAEYTQGPVVKFIESLGGVVVNRFWLDNVILVRIPAGLVSKIAAHPDVVRVFENFEVRLIEPVRREIIDIKTMQVSSWGIFKIRANETWALGITGQGIRIAVLDTGVDITHPALAGKMLSVIPGDPYYPGGWMEFDSAGNPVRSLPHDTHGHGTHCSGTALGGNTVDVLIGVAPGATLMHGLVLPGGGGTFAQVLAGMQWTVEPYYLTPDGQKVYTGLPAHVVSMSWGANEYYSNDLLPAVEAMLLANIVPVAAIGNGGPGTTSNPGNIWGVFGIGATDINDAVAGWSSGKVVTWPSPPPTWPFFDTYPSTYIKPDLSAPGVDIVSSVPGGGYQAWSGTSMATPHVAGTVALMLQAAGWFNYDEPDVPEKVYLILNSTAIDFGDPGQDTRYGWGRIDAYEAVREAFEYAKKSGVEGFVLDEVTGEPVPWATVTVVEINQTFKVNATGGFKIPLDPGNYTLVFSAWGYQNVTKTIEVVLLNGTITGVVSNAILGAPIPGASVTVVELNLTVYTDADGVYVVSVPPGTYTLNASATGYSPSATSVTVGENETVLVNFQLYPVGNGTIAGYVKDAVTNAPIPDAAVWTYVGGELVFNFTDDTGYYELDVPSGNYTVYAWKPGYEQANVTGVIVVPSQVTWVDFYLEPIPPTVVVLANVHYRTQPHLKMIIESLGLPVVEYNDMDVLVQDWVNGVINPKVVVIDHTKPSRFSYPPNTTVLALHLLADASGASLIWLGTSYSGYTGIDVLLLYNATLVANGYPAPNSRLIAYPAPIYVQVEMLNMTHPIFDGVTPDVPGYPNRFYLGTGSYVDYAVYNFTDPTGRFNILGYVRDTRSGFERNFGVGVAEWYSNTGVPWYYLGSWAESEWMQYLEPGRDGMYTDNTKKVLENAVLLAWNATTTSLSVGSRELTIKVINTVLGIIKPLTSDRRFEPHLYTQVIVYMPRLPHGFVTGRVVGSDGAVLAGAKVEVVNTPIILTTNATGHFYTWLPEGTYTLRISYPGYQTKEVVVTVSVNETVDLGDIVLGRTPRVAIMWDYAGSLKSFFESKGWYAASYTNLTQLTNDILAGMYNAVIYAGYYGVPFPTAAEFYAFLNATMQMGVGVVWMDSWGSFGYGIKVLRQYLNDPPSVGSSWGYGDVYIKVTGAHPILRGYSVGDVINIIAYANADFSWFSGFSGTPIADTYVGGTIWGNAIAWKVFDNGVKWALLSSFAPTSWNLPSYFTSDAWNIIYNAVIWVASRPLNVTLENPYLRVGDLGVLYITGGPAYTTLYVYLDGLLFATVETDEYGSATLQFTVPLIPGGEHLFEVSTEDTLYYGYANLYVLPKVIVTPTVIPAPGVIYVEVTGLQPYQLVYIYLDGNYLSMYRANVSGAFSIKLNIPLVEQGDHDILIVDATTGDVLEGATITVESRLDNVLSKLDQLLLAADQLGLKIDAVLNDTVIIRSNLGVIEVKIDTLLEKIGLLNATIIGYRDDIVYIKTKIGLLEVKIDNILSKLDVLDAKIASIKGDTVTIITRLGTLEVKGDIVTILTKLDKLEVKFDTILSKLDDLNAKIVSVKNDTLTIITKLGTLEVNVSTILERLGALNAVITSIRDDVVYIKTKIGDLEAKLGDLMDALRNVNATITGLIVDKSGELYGIIETRYGDIIAKADALGKLIENKLPIDTRTLNDSIMAKINELLGKIGSVESQVGKVESQAENVSTYAIGALASSVVTLLAVLYIAFAKRR